MTSQGIYYVENKANIKIFPQNTNSNYYSLNNATPLTIEKNQNEIELRNRKSNFTSKIKKLTNDQLYEEAALILGLTCSQKNNCKCIECQCHYFDYQEDSETNTDNDMSEKSMCCIQ